MTRGVLPPKYNCDHLYWYDAIDSIEGPVEDYELAIREWIPGQSPCNVTGFVLPESE
jgi:hypothetical protein